MEFNLFNFIENLLIILNLIGVGIICWAIVKYFKGRRIVDEELEKSETITNISKDNIVKMCLFDEIPHYGHVISYKDFIEEIGSGFFTSVDGSADLILFDQVIENAEVYVDKQCIIFVTFSNYTMFSFEELHSIFEDDMKFIWFNK